MTTEETTIQRDQVKSETAVILKLIGNLLKIEEPSESDLAELGGLLLDGVRRSTAESLAGKTTS